MKWTFLKRRSEVQKLDIQVSPVSGTCFDPSNSNNSKRQNEQTPVDVGSTSNEQDEVSKNSQSTLQAVPAPIQEQLGEQNPIDTGSTLQENEQKRIDMVLAEIQIILTERPPIAGIKHGNAALPASEKG